MPAIPFNYEVRDIPPTTAFPDGQRVLTPMLHGKVSVQQGQGVLCRLCLDTGADRCTFPLSFAGRLGLNQAAMPEGVNRGSTGTSPVYYAEVDIEIPYLHNGRRYRWNLKTVAGFVAGMDAQGFGVLGQIGFFDEFCVTFNQR